MYAEPHAATSARNAAPDSVVCIATQAVPKDHLFEISSVQDVLAKETIFWQGDPGSYVYEVLEGIVLLSKLTPDGRRQVMGFVHAGQPFGLGMNEEYAYTAETVTDAKLCRYPRRRFYQSIGTHPEIARRFLASTSSELALAQEQMLLLGRMTATERVASFLLRLSERNEKQAGDPMQIFLPMTRTDMGDYLGLSTETVSRSIGRLKDLGIIELQRSSRVTVLDLDRLIDIAEDESCCR